MDYNKLAAEKTVQKTIAALKKRNIEALSVAAGADALEKIKALIPENASVMNGASRTLEQIGFIDFLKSNRHKWNNLHEAIVKEQDREKQARLRQQAVLSDYYLGSVHALTETGELVIASKSGSQLPHIVYTSPNVIFVASTKKIVPTLSDAIDRLKNYVVPLEDKHMQALYGSGTALNKLVIFKGESDTSGRKIRLILVNEDLGF